MIFQIIEIMRKMKVTSSILILFFISLCTTNGMFGQSSDYDLIMKELTKEQKELLLKEREMIKNNREALKKSLTKEQLAILTDKALRNDIKRKRLLQSFSRQQKTLVQRQEKSLRVTRENFRKTLTDNQRKILKDRIERSRRDRKKPRGN